MLGNNYEETRLADISRPQFLFFCSYDGSRKLILIVSTYQILRHHVPGVRYVNVLFTFTLKANEFSNNEDHIRKGSHFGKSSFTCY